MKDYTAKIILDSVHDTRLTTMEVTYPRFVHSEMMTHRMFSRNSASSRAIPVSKMLEQVANNPSYPVWWGKQQSGMQANEPLDGTALTVAKTYWNKARSEAIENATRMSEAGAHKQLVNRLLEPFSWITVIITATDWANFFSLRCHPDAQPEIRHIAEKMKAAYEESVPQKLGNYEWHMPFVQKEDWVEILKQYPTDRYDSQPRVEAAKKISVARCARVSYLTHDGIRNYNKDLELYERLVGGSGGAGHASPFEHIATPSGDLGYHANFKGWKQLRHMVFNDSNISNKKSIG